MNRVFNLVWDKARHQVVVASELARGGKKTGSGPRKLSAGSRNARRVHWSLAIIGLAVSFLAFSPAWAQGTIKVGGDSHGSPYTISGDLSTSNTFPRYIKVLDGGNLTIGSGATVTNTLKSKPDTHLKDAKVLEVHGSGSKATIEGATLVLDNDVLTGADTSAIHVTKGGEVDIGAGSTIKTTGSVGSPAIAPGNGGTLKVTGNKNNHVTIFASGGDEGIGVNLWNGKAGKTTKANLSYADIEADGYGIAVTSDPGLVSGLSDGEYLNDLEADHIKVTTTGTGYGVGIKHGSKGVLEDSTITTKADNSTGLTVSDHSLVTMTGGSITTSGEYSDGVVATNNGTANLTNLDITTQYGRSDNPPAGFFDNHALFAKDGGRITGNSLTIKGSSNDYGDGVVTAGSHGTITLTGSTVDNTYQNASGSAVGASANGLDAVLNLNSTDVTVNSNKGGYGASAAVVKAWAGGEVNMNVGDAAASPSSRNKITSHGDYVFGVVSAGTDSNNTGSAFNANNVAISTEGSHSFGLSAQGGGTAVLTNSSVTTTGVHALGLESKTSLTATKVAVSTTGDESTGAVADGGLLNLTDSSLETKGKATGLGVYDGGTATLGNTTISTHEDTAVGAVIVDGSSLTMDGGSIATEGDGAYGSYVLGENSSLIMHGVNITTEGKGADGVYVTSKASVTITGSTIQADGQDSSGIALKDNGTVHVIGTKIRSTGPSVVSNFTQSGQNQAVTFGAGTTAVQNNGTLLLVNRTDEGADGNITLTLGKGSVSSGAINDTQQLNAADRGNINLVLSPGAVWNGHVEGQLGDTDVSSGSNFAPSADTTVNGDIDNGGQVTASSGTTITTTNNYTSSDGSTLAIGVSSDGGGTVVTHGTATIGDGSQLAFVGQPDSQGGTYVFLDAPKIDGRYDLDNVTVNGKPLSDLAFYQLGVVGDPQYVLTSLPVNAPGVADTANEQAAADGIASLDSSNAVQQTVHGLSYSDAREAFNALSGEFYASRQTALLGDTRHLRQAVSDRLSQHCTDTAETRSNGSTLCGRMVWMQAFGDWGHIDGDDNVAQMERQSGGVFIGADQSLTPHVRLGFVIGYGHGDSDINDSRDSHGRNDSYHLGLYTGAHYGALRLKAGLAHTWYDLDSRRSVQYPGFNDNLSVKNNHASNTQVFAEVGYAFDFDVAQVTPFVQGAYVHLHTDGFTEDGGAAALTGNSTSDDIGTSLAGVRLSRVISRDGGATFRFNGVIGWQHTFGDTTPEQRLALKNGQPYTVTGVPLNRNAVAVKAGFDGQLNQNVTVGLSYVGQFGDGTTSNGLKGNFTWAF